jgi:hypothetical protein
MDAGGWKRIFFEKEFSNASLNTESGLNYRIENSMIQVRDYKSQTARYSLFEQDLILKSQDYEVSKIK